MSKRLKVTNGSYEEKVEAVTVTAAGAGDIDLIPWNSLHVPAQELDLKTVLTCGQAFRWKKRETTTTDSKDQEWIGVFQKRLWILKQDKEKEKLYYKVMYKSRGIDKADLVEIDNETALKNYFQFDISLVNLYQEWREKDSKFASLTLDNFQGIRIMLQDPIETIFGFICSSNNFIGRISSMVENLCSTYGEPIVNVDGVLHYDFPTVDAIVNKKNVEQDLRDMKFGYRAGYIAKTAQQILENGGEEWAINLRKVGYNEARKQLISLSGIGPKVADCICLMALGYHDCVPVDTHIHQIAKERMPHVNKAKNITEKIYKDIGDYFRLIYGTHAGWAQSILFSSTLTHLKKGNETSADNCGSKAKRAKKDLENE